MDSMTLIWLIAMVAIFYFLMIRPQKKKEKEDRILRNNLKPGNVITTIGGITGRVLSVKDGEVTFETGPDRTKLTIKKWAVQSKELTEEEKAEQAAAAAKLEEERQAKKAAKKNKKSKDIE